MKFRAILIGALVQPFGGKGVPVQWQRFCQSQAEAETLGRAVLNGLPPDERKGAFVQVIEMREVVIGEIR